MRWALFGVGAYWAFSKYDAYMPWQELVFKRRPAVHSSDRQNAPRGRRSAVSNTQIAPTGYSPKYELGIITSASEVTFSSALVVC